MAPLVLSPIRVSVTCAGCGAVTTAVLTSDAPKASCLKCARDLVTAEAVGFVYLLTNPSMPGLVKIGRTTRILTTRADELRGTGVPTPFEIAGYFVTSTPVEDEQALHCRLAAHRESPDREFFRIPLGEALLVAEQLLGPASQRRAASPPLSYDQVADGTIKTPARFVVDPGGNVLDQRVFVEPVPDENG